MGKILLSLLIVSSTHVLASQQIQDQVLVERDTTQHLSRGEIISAYQDLFLDPWEKLVKGGNLTEAERLNNETMTRIKPYLAFDNPDFSRNRAFETQDYYQAYARTGLRAGDLFSTFSFLPSDSRDVLIKRALGRIALLENTLQRRHGAIADLQAKEKDESRSLHNQILAEMGEHASSLRKRVQGCRDALPEDKDLTRDILTLLDLIESQAGLVVDTLSRKARGDLSRQIKSLVSLANSLTRLKEKAQDPAYDMFVATAPLVGSYLYIIRSDILAYLKEDTSKSLKAWEEEKLQNQMRNLEAFLKDTQDQLTHERKKLTFLEEHADFFETKMRSRADLLGLNPVHWRRVGPTLRLSDHVRDEKTHNLYIKLLDAFNVSQSDPNLQNEIDQARWETISLMNLMYTHFEWTPFFGHFSRQVDVLRRFIQSFDTDETQELYTSFEAFVSYIQTHLAARQMHDPLFKRIKLGEGVSIGVVDMFSPSRKPSLSLLTRSFFPHAGRYMRHLDSRPGEENHGIEVASVALEGGRDADITIGIAPQSSWEILNSIDMSHGYDDRGTRESHLFYFARTFRSAQEMSRYMSELVKEGRVAEYNFDLTKAQDNPIVRSPCCILNMSFLPSDLRATKDRPEGFEGVHMVPAITSMMQNKLAVWAAGNDGFTLSGSSRNRWLQALALTPEIKEGLLIVGNLNGDGVTLNGSSNFPGEDKAVQDRTLCAPGTDITALDPVTGRKVKRTGTSYAAPHVTGLAAVVQSNFVGLTPFDVGKALLRGAIPIVMDEDDVSCDVPGITAADLALRFEDDHVLETTVGDLRITRSHWEKGRFYFGQGRVNLQGALFEAMLMSGHHTPFYHHLEPLRVTRESQERQRNETLDAHLVKKSAR